MLVWIIELWIWTALDGLQDNGFGLPYSLLGGGGTFHEWGLAEEFRPLEIGLGWGCWDLGLFSLFACQTP